MAVAVTAGGFVAVVVVAIHVVAFDVTRPDAFDNYYYYYYYHQDVSSRRSVIGPFDPSLLLHCRRVYRCYFERWTDCYCDCCSIHCCAPHHLHYWPITMPTKVPT